MIAAGLAVSVVHAADDDPAACPTAFSKDVVIGVFHNLGQNMRVATRCNLPPSRIAQATTKMRDDLRPCVRKHGISAKEIDAALAQGAALGNRIYDESGVRKALCEATDAAL